MSDFKVDYIGIGANKAGTSWVNKMLSAHPQICTAEPKEVHFFHEVTSFTRKTHSGNFAKGLNWYRQFFKHCSADKLKGEITPKYMIDPLVPERIKRYFPEVKLILCLRSPVDRAVSQYNFEKYFIRRENRPLSRALREQSEYVQNGLYFEALQRYMAHFPLSHIHCIWFEDIISNPEKVVAELYSFLGVRSDFVPVAIFQKENSAQRAKSKWVRDFLAAGERDLAAVGLSWFVRGVKKFRINKLISFFNSSNIAYEGLSIEDEVWLMEQFRADILQLQGLTGRDLSTWLAARKVSAE